jgi:excisionase family DNA binding protein
MRKREFFERDLMWGEVMERLLTIEETAQALKVKKSWLYARIHAGTLPFPFVKIGHYVRIPEEGIREYIQCVTVLPKTNHGNRK